MFPFPSRAVAGFRHVRVDTSSVARGGTTAAFECAFYSEGKERYIGQSATARGAAVAYQSHVEGVLLDRRRRLVEARRQARREEANRVRRAQRAAESEAARREVEAVQRAVSEAAVGRAAGAIASGAVGLPTGMVVADQALRLRQKKMRCGECEACQAENCGTCRFCIDMPKNGGSGTLRQPCVLRTCKNKTYESSGAVAPPPPEPEVYDERLVGRRVRAMRAAVTGAAAAVAGSWHAGTVVEYQAPVTRHGQPRFCVRFDDGLEAEYTMPDNPDCLLLPKGAAESGTDPLAGLSLADQRSAYKAAAAAAEAAARAAVKAEGLKLLTSARTETGYRCVSTHRLARLGLMAYEVKTTCDGESVNLGRFPSKTQAAVAFARYMATQDATAVRPARAGRYGNMVLPFEVLDAMEDGTVNTIEKVLDVREVEVEVPDEVAEPFSAAGQAEGDAYHLPGGSDRKRTKASVAARAAAGPSASDPPSRTKQSVAAAAAGIAVKPSVLAVQGVEPVSGSACKLLDWSARTSSKENQPVTQQMGRATPVLSASGMCTAGACPNRGSARHPRLPVALCVIHASRNAELLADGWPKGDDDEEDACRWCCGLSLDALDRPVASMEVSTVLCDTCGKAWCSECISSNLGHEYWAHVAALPDDQQWRCFYCDPGLLEKLIGGGQPTADPSRGAGCSAAAPAAALATPAPPEAFPAADSSPGSAEAPRRMALVREYLVKLRGFSYVRSVWKTADEIEADGRLSKAALARFLRRMADGEPVDVTYKSHMLVDRVISRREAAGFDEYLVKWQQLPYAECSWEDAPDVPAAAIAAFEAREGGETAVDFSKCDTGPTTSWIRKDMELEVAPNLPALAGAWYAAVATRMSQKRLTVEYKSLIKDEDEAVPTKLSERVDVLRVRPPVPQRPRGWAPAPGEPVQVLHADGWWVAVVKTYRRRGEPLIDDTPPVSWEDLLGGDASANPDEPAVGAHTLVLGTQMGGRDGQTWEVRLGDTRALGRSEQCWVAVNAEAADSRTRSSVRTVRGRLPAKVAGSRVVVKYLEAEPEPAELPPTADGPQTLCCSCGTVLDDEAGEVVAPSVGCDQAGCEHWACIPCAGFEGESDSQLGSKLWFCPAHDKKKPKPKKLFYTGVVLRYRPELGLLVRFDGFADGSPDAEGWVEETGEDDWCWEEQFDERSDEAKRAEVVTEVARENVYFVVSPGDKLRIWVPYKELRPNWVWKSPEEGWEVGEELHMPGEVPPADELEMDVDAEAEGEGGDSRPGSRNAQQPPVAAGEGSRPTGRKRRAGDDEDDPAYAEPGEQAEAEARPESDDDEDAPAEVTGWAKLDESPVFPSAGTGDRMLREYQLAGLNWLRLNWYLGRNVILGDEMGLGKTAQTLALLQTLRSMEKLNGPFLIVVPLSTITHWEREAAAWTDAYTVLFHGSADSRRVILQHDWGEPAPKGQVRYRFHIVITTYETVMQDPEPLTKIKWTYLIVDEGHKLKNRHSKLVEAMRELRARRRLVLTGTPLQNHVSELWSILNFLDPKKFDDLDAFLADYGALSAGTGTVEQVNKLNKLLKPHLLRREKADVEKSLHALKETLVYVEITNLQKLCYRACLEQNRTLLLHGVGAANAGTMSFNNVSMMLRHCCNHPWLIREIEQSALSQLAAESSMRTPATLAEHNDAELWSATRARLEDEDEARYRDRLVQSSGKLVLLDKLLPKLKADGHRVLLFSQFTKMLDLIEDLVQGRGWGYERLDGAVTGRERQAAIDRFSDPASESFIFIITTRAGGVGINLTAADTIVMFDPDWNPQNDLQAMARCHRIGQTKPVQVFRLCTKDTYEMHMLATANTKLGLEHAVMRTSGSGYAEKAMTATGFGRSARLGDLAAKDRASQIERLLRSGAQVLLRDEQDASAAAFGRSSIEEILESYSETRTVSADGEGGAAPGGAAGPSASSSTFAHAEFVSETSGTSVNLDDPNFWAKMLPEVPTLAAAADTAAVPAAADAPSWRPFAKVKPKGDQLDRVLQVRKRKRRRDDIAELSDDDAGGAHDEKRSRWAPWSAADLEAVLEVMLAYGHARSVDAATEATQRGVRQVRRAADWMLAHALLAATAELRCEWGRALGMHTATDTTLASLCACEDCALGRSGPTRAGELRPIPQAEEAPERGRMGCEACRGKHRPHTCSRRGGHKPPPRRAPAAVAPPVAVAAQTGAAARAGAAAGSSGVGPAGRTTDAVPKVFHGVLPPPTLPLATIVERTLKLMEDQHLTQNMLCHQLQFSPVYLSNFLRRRSMTVAKAAIYASALQQWLADQSFTITDPTVTGTQPHQVPGPCPPSGERGHHLRGRRPVRKAAFAPRPMSDEALVHALGVLTRKLRPPVDEEGTELPDTLSVRAAAPHVLSRLLALRALDEAVERDAAADGTGLPELPAWQHYGGWDSLCDRRLLVGVHRHGVGAWGAMRADGSLGWPAVLDASDDAAEAPPTAEEGEYEVEAVMAERCGPGGGLQYLVKWKGWDEPEDATWEVEANVADTAALDVFLYKKDHDGAQFEWPTDDELAARAELLIEAIRDERRRRSALGGAGDGSTETAGGEATSEDDEMVEVEVEVEYDEEDDEIVDVDGPELPELDE